MKTEEIDKSIAFQMGVRAKKHGSKLEEAVGGLPVGSQQNEDFVAGYHCSDLNLRQKLETEGCFVTDIFEFSSAYSAKRLP